MAAFFVGGIRYQHQEIFLLSLLPFTSCLPKPSFDSSAVQRHRPRDRLKLLRPDIWSDNERPCNTPRPSASIEHNRVEELCLRQGESHLSISHVGAVSRTNLGRHVHVHACPNHDHMKWHTIEHPNCPDLVRLGKDGGIADEAKPGRHIWQASTCAHQMHLQHDPGTSSHATISSPASSYLPQTFWTLLAFKHSASLFLPEGPQRHHQQSATSQDTSKPPMSLLQRPNTTRTPQSPSRSPTLRVHAIHTHRCMDRSRLSPDAAPATTCPDTLSDEGRSLESTTT